MNSITDHEYIANIKRACDYLVKELGLAEVAIVLGSGMSKFADVAFTAENPAKVVRYADVPGLPNTSVAGHRGCVYYGDIAGHRCVLFAGRFHSYEGFSGETVCLLPRIAAGMGCHTYLLTNAAGGTLKGMRTGCLMAISNHAASVRWSPLYNVACPPIDSRNVYSRRLIDLAHEIVSDPDFQRVTSFDLKEEHDRTVELHESTYIFNSGPAYETHAETQLEHEIAPGTVGMSSVPEALASAALGLECFGLSLVTNLGAGLSDEILTHEDVGNVANAVSAAVQELFSRMLQRIPKREPHPRFMEPVSKEQAMPLVPVPEACPSWDKISATVEAMEVPHGSNVEIAAFINGPVFSMEIDEARKCLKVTAPATIGMSKTMLALGVARELGAKCVLVEVADLPEGTPFIPAGNVVNYTSEHMVAVPTPAVGEVVKPMACSNRPRLMFTEGPEIPETNVLLRNGATRLGIEHLTCSASPLPLLIARAVGFGFVAAVRAIDQFIDERDSCCACKCNPPKTPARWTIDTRVPKYRLFGVETPSVESVKELAKEIRKQVGIADGVKVNKTHFIQVEGTEAASYEFNAESSILTVHLPQVGVPASFEDCSRIVRAAAQFINDGHAVESAVVIGNARLTCIPFEQRGKFVVLRDIINISGVNPLRGENHAEFGVRFPDVGDICSAKLREKFIKEHSDLIAEEKGAIAIVSLTGNKLLTRIAEEKMKENHFVHAYAGNFLPLLDLAHARIPTLALAVDETCVPHF